MPKERKTRQYGQYTKETLHKALDAVDQGKMSLWKAAVKFGVPRTTLTSYYEDRNRKGKTGPALTFTDAEEQMLVEWIRDMYQKGMFCRTADVLDAARWILDNYPRRGKQKDSHLSSSWVRSFYKRHPEMTTYLRVDMDDPPIMSEQKCYETVFQHLNCLETFDDTSRIFKYSEVKFALCSNFHNYIAGETVTNKANLITTGIITSVSGRMAFPTIIYPHEGTIPLELAATVPLFYGYGSSPSGTATNTTFYNYVTKVFYKYLRLNRIPLPVVLFVDGTKANVSFLLWRACKALDICLLAFNPEESLNYDRKYFAPKTILTTHIVEKLREELARWRESNGNRISEMHFAELLQPVVHNHTPDGVIKDDWIKFRFYQWILQRRLRIEDIEFVSATKPVVAAKGKKSPTEQDDESSDELPVVAEKEEPLEESSEEPPL